MLVKIIFKSKFSFVLLIETVIRIPGWFQTHYVAKDNLKLLILLTRPPECWDYKYVYATTSSL